MKVTYNWLKDFVNIKITPRVLAEKLTMVGLEVTSLEECDGDFVFEMEITSNRPDCLSVVGIAREVAAITGKKLKNVSSLRSQVSGKKLQPATCNLQLKIEDKKDCPLYTAKIIRDIKVGPSPDWLKKRLELVGCRSVNNVVDITNYVLFEWGEPLHAFDLDKLSGDTIIVRRANGGEKITSIDGGQRTLNPNILVIADKKQAVAIAGIIGGKDTEVTESTKNILLEAAIFTPVVIRRARQKLGLQSESSYRFERGVDSQTVENASWQAVRLIQELAGGKCSLVRSSGLPKRKKVNIKLGVSTVQSILGVNITPLQIKKILNGLGFKIKTKTGGVLVVEVPAYRSDAELEIDLIEEIARIFGYERIPITVPKVMPKISAYDTRDLVTLIKNTLIGLGLNEVITYSLIDRNLLEDFSGFFPNPTEILNPLSKEQEILRPTLIPSLSKCVAYNLNQKQNYVNIFEIAKIFPSLSEASPGEELALGIALCGEKSLLLGGGLIKEEMGILHLKGILEVLFERLGIKKYNFNLKNFYEASLYIAEEKIGVMIKLQKNTLDNLEIKNKDVIVAEINLEKVFPYVNLGKVFTPLPVYPGISRDISLILKDEVKIEDVFKATREKGEPLLRQVNVVDYYKGKQIPAGFKGLTISCIYRSDERTLTETEINPVHALVVGVLIDRFGARIR